MAAAKITFKNAPDTEKPGFYSLQTRTEKTEPKNALRVESVRQSDIKLISQTLICSFNT